MSDTTVCELCGNVNTRGATMCAWCETSLSGPFTAEWKPPAPPRRPTIRDSLIPPLAPRLPPLPPRRPDAAAHDWDGSAERWWSTAANVLVISALVCIALACPVITAVLLRKQEVVDSTGSTYSETSWHRSGEFPVYGALSLIPTLTCALTVYLLFRWITRRSDDEH